MVGSKAVPVINATYADAHKAVVSDVAVYNAAEKGIVDFQNGQMIGVGQGMTTVEATYTDVLGNVLSASFNAKSSYFPFDYPFVRNNIAGTGTYTKNTSNSVFKFTSSDSQMVFILPLRRYTALNQFSMP